MNLDLQKLAEVAEMCEARAVGTGDILFRGLAEVLTDVRHEVLAWKDKELAKEEGNHAI